MKKQKNKGMKQYAFFVGVLLSLCVALYGCGAEGLYYGAHALGALDIADSLIPEPDEPESPASQREWFYFRKGKEAEKRGDYDEAITIMTKSIDSRDFSNRRQGIAHYCRGLVWFKKRQYDKAIDDHDMAMMLNPRGAPYYLCARGNALVKKGKYDKGITDINKAFAQKKDALVIYSSLAWLLATCPLDKYRDGEKALKFAKKAVTAKFNKDKETAANLAEAGVITRQVTEDPELLEILAAAYAEVAMFPQAINTQEKAISLFEQKGQYLRIAGSTERIEIYKAQKPWREVSQ